ncbi:MAG: hypothetical protein HY788_24080 [Deltaproteobacteria bacterium]|nr:hypothetical protein [Deltaproteobacteria bacterium]
MKFAADRMLGRLAKWLRILGYDTIYDQNMDANSVLSYTRDGRTVLTRGGRFRKDFLRGIVWIQDDRVDWQIRQLLNENYIDAQGKEKFLLCSRCNVKLLAANYPEAEGRVPEYVMHSQKKILRCPACNRFYWSGTHQERMRHYIRARVIETKEPESFSGGE